MSFFSEMFGRATNLWRVLNEMLRAEESLVRTYARLVHLNAAGGLPRHLYDAYVIRRIEANAVQQDVYRKIVDALRPTGMADRIPRPTGYPELPPWIDPRARAAASRGAAGVSSAGLGAVPVAVWVVGVIVALAQIAAVAYVTVQAITFGSTLVRNVYAMRENTRRDELRVEAQQSRFEDCVRRTNNPAQCAQAFPLPEAPREDAGSATPPVDPMLVAAGIGAAVLSIGVVGYIFYQFASPGRLSEWRATSSTPKGISSARGAPRRLSGSEVSRALRGER